MWLWLRENKPIWLAVVGGVILILSGLYLRFNPLTLGACMLHTVACLWCFLFFGVGR